jgi:nitroreductase
MSMSIEEINNFKQAPVEGMLPALAHRWSPRSFTEAPVAAADLKIILEAARWAASSSNVQPWRFLVGKKGSETHTKIFSTLVGFNQAWAGKPDVLILGLAEQKDSKGNLNKYALYDLGQASACLCVQASALGIHTHSMGGFNHSAAQTAFNLTEDHVVGAVIALGYQDEPSAITVEQLREREVAPRERRPLNEIALVELAKAFEF